MCPPRVLGLDTGRDSRFPSFEAAWVFVFLAAVSSGAGGLVELKAERGQAGAAGAGDLPGGTEVVAGDMGHCCHPPGFAPVLRG